MIMKNLFKGIKTSSFLLTCFLTGCAGQSGNQKLAETQTADFNQILVKGQSSKESVIEYFGEPSDTDILDDGREKWTYSHLRKDAKFVSYVPVANWFSSGTNDTTKKLVIIFRNGVVENFSSSTSLGETKGGLFN